MDYRLAELFSELLHNDSVEAEISDDYSGRNMYGDTTYSVSGDFSAASLLVLVLESVKDGYLTEDMLEGIKISARMDSMGLGSVIY